MMPGAGGDGEVRRPPHVLNVGRGSGAVEGIAASIVGSGETVGGKVLFSHSAFSFSVCGHIALVCRVFRLPFASPSGGAG